MATPISIVDLSTLLYDFTALRDLSRNKSLVIPFPVLDKLRENRAGRGMEGRNSREFFSLFNEMRQNGEISTEMGAPVVVWRDSQKRVSEISREFTDKWVDKAVIATAKEFKEMGYKPVIYTRDSVVSMMAEAFNVKVAFYKQNKFRAEDLYPGYRTIEVPEALITAIKSRQNISIDETFLPNEYIQLVNEEQTLNAYCRFDAKQKELVPLDLASSEIPRWISPRNIEQSFALDALLNDDIKLVSLIGKAGTGKTILALAAGLYKSLDCDLYERVLVSRPTLPMGQDIGYLPGSIEEKLGPWMHPIADNIDFILKSRKCGRPNMRSFSDLAEMDMVVIEPLTFIRGRSIHDQFLLVDEAQNLSQHEIRTILTRAGEGTKIVLAGDPYQIDNPELTSRTSGLMQVVERFCDESIAAHITMTKGERSELSELAADLL